MTARDGANISLWQETEPFTETPADTSGTFDVLIIGGGITGLSTALQLQQQGKKCILAEARNIGYGTTGGTTAHLNSFFDEPYSKVRKNFGADAAKLLAKGAAYALNTISSQVKQHQIACGFAEKDAYLFAIGEKQLEDLEDIIEGAAEAGVEIQYTNQTPYPIPYLKIARVTGQAQFHPLQYITGLAHAFEAAGGVILQQCMVESMQEDEIITASTTRGHISARHAVYATHIPPGVNMIHFRCAPYRSYAMAFTLRSGEYPADLGYDLCDPYRYYRTQEIEGKQYLIAGGEDHKTGHEEFTNAPFRRLESYVRSYFDVESVAFKWSSQYYQPVDGLPFIGHLPGHRSNVYVATAFGGNGMIYGTLSAKVLSDLILTGSSEYEKLFQPARIKPLAGMREFVRENADVVKEFFKGKLSATELNGLADLAPGEGKLVDYKDTRIALYKDEKHGIHAINPTCTHVHCTVAWNETECSWDCPCHGARFSTDGKVLNGPASKSLEPIHIQSA